MSSPPWPRRGVCRRGRRRVWAYLVVGLLVPGAALWDGHVTLAAFSAMTGSSALLSTAVSFPTYPNAVAADSPWAYHRAEEAASAASTTTAVDSSGNGRAGVDNGTTNGPSTWWRLDDGSGSTAGDSSGGANAATLHGSPAWTAGITGGGLSLNGSSDYGAASSQAVHTNAAFTVTAWAKLTSSVIGTSDRSVVSQGGTHTYGFALGVDSASGKWMVAATNSDASNPTVKKQFSKNLAVVGTWTHLAGVYNPSTTSLDLYINGTSNGSATKTLSWDATGGVQFGRMLSADAYTGYFPGVVDDVRVYGRALSATEIRNLGGTQLRSHLDFSEGAGATTSDSGMNGGTATLSGTSWNGGGHAGSDLSFDGSSSYVQGAGAAVETNESFSVSAWVYPTSTGSDRTAVSQDGGTISGFYLGYNSSSDRWAFTMRSSDSTGSTAKTALSTLAPSLNTWVHLVGVYDSVAATAALYVSGTLQNTATSITSWDATGSLQVGRGLWSSPTNYWAGQVDSVRAFQRPLTSSDVTTLSTDTDPTLSFTEANMTSGVIGALQGTQQGLSSATAIAFAGTANAYNSTQVVNPVPFTVECWFRASGTAGGAMVSFGASTTGMGAENTDRLVYLNNTQHVVFRVDDGTARSLTSPSTYADGAWHHLAASVGSAGMKLYLDGALAASNPGVTSALSMTGYWRWGGSPLIGLPDRPTNDRLLGSLDEIAIYSTQLVDSEIAIHNAANH